MDIRGIAQFPGPPPSSDPSFRAGSPGGAISSTAGQRQAIATPDTTDGVKTASEVELPKLLRHPLVTAERQSRRSSRTMWSRHLWEAGALAARRPASPSRVGSPRQIGRRAHRRVERHRRFFFFRFRWNTERVR